MIKYAGYTGVFEFDADLEVFSGFVVDLRDQIYFEGHSVKELKTSMRRAIDHYLETCRSRGEEPERPFSGKLNVRLGPELHRSIALAAAGRGQSINTWIVDAVRSAVGGHRGSLPVTRREIRGRRNTVR